MNDEEVIKQNTKHPTVESNTVSSISPSKTEQSHSVVSLWPQKWFRMCTTWWWLGSNQLYPWLLVSTRSKHLFCSQIMYIVLFNASISQPISNLMINIPQTSIVFWGLKMDSVVILTSTFTKFWTTGFLLSSTVGKTLLVEDEIPLIFSNPQKHFFTLLVCGALFGFELFLEFATNYKMLRVGPEIIDIFR